jgi:hypothetical protein
VSGLRTARGLALGFLGGMAAGLLVWSRQLRADRRSLFSRNPVRRLAALGYLRAHPSVENARLLRDFLRWETRPALRRRGEAVLLEMESLLE